MITAIKEDEAKCERGEYLPFQLVGANHLLSDGEEKINCASWCIGKLVLAGVTEVAGIKSKPKKLSSQSCAIL